MESRKRNRKQDFDYSKDGIYFITACCKKRIHHFGEIINGEMQLNEFGIIAHNQILWIETQYTYVELHNFVVMPNHVHILFEIVGTGRDLSPHSPEIDYAGISSISHGSSLIDGTRTGRDMSLLKIKSISSLIGAYKTTSSKSIHLAGNYDFFWQRSFYDSIVLVTEQYDAIYNYITENPKRWIKDVFNQETNPNC